MGQERRNRSEKSLSKKDILKLNTMYNCSSSGNSNNGSNSSSKSEEDSDEMSSIYDLFSG
ncbi:hypothetical protein J6590_097217 [Homalodisca vitripennis]|nr:hypothetical protein J6590_097217 [Homalodisca vitripennis]